ncbi:Cse1-domain-containing protein [Violaceomyces palustris]|uniref:Cse1-domain-containing protein n=1 Tax=Violaceomyces palustris TaxID=1673888 RepID=A0ACD0NUX4_9BASI|nr:Cse1-domain-containing protein [Violaceomyces palustris]
METSAEHLALLSSLLAQTLDPSQRKSAEQQLVQAQQVPGFPQLLLTLIQNVQYQSSDAVRLAAAIKLKNICRSSWLQDEEEDSTSPVLSSGDKEALKADILPLLVSLSSNSSGNPPAPTSIRAQLEETIAIVAEKDFPERWPGLIDSIVPHLKGTDYELILGMLRTSHTIFYRWRSAFRSDELYSEINFVLERFASPHLELLQRVDGLLFDQATPIEAVPALGSCLVLLLQTFNDLSSQDLPPQFEDNMPMITSILSRWILQGRAELEGDEDERGALQEIRSSICEIIELYAKRYLDAFGQLPTFVQAIWEMLGKCGSSEKYDVLVSKAVGFLSTVVRMGSQREMFQDPSTLEQLCSAIILPNIVLREADEELFEDNPIEYIRRDFETSVENDTRRKAASEFCRALMEQFSDEVTSIVSRYIGQYLQGFAADPASNWKQKDTAIYLLTSIATKSSTSQHGVSSTNTLVDVVQFFSDHVFQDLQQSESECASPILQVDAIKYLHTFRNQLTKEQLLSVLPLLVKHLESSQYVTCSYASITIERVLAIARDGRLLFSSSDVQPFSESILMALFRNIERGSTPEKLAENDYLMKCVMRMITTSRAALAPAYGAILGHLTAILAEVSKNPSNPRFNQYLFESISALVRFVVPAQPGDLSSFEDALFGPFTSILQSDVAEFAPYVFQILSQMLELHSDSQMPEAYASLLPPLLMPALWEQRGNVPALVRLLRAFLSKGSDRIVANGQLQSLLGIYQKLIASRLNDSYGFELLESIFENISTTHMEPFKGRVLTLMLTRLQSSKTDKFVKSFIYFVCFLCCQQKDHFPDYVISIFESVQPGLFLQILQGVILPEIQSLPERNRRVAAVGLSRLLTASQQMQTSPLVQVWPATLEALLRLFLLPQALSKGSQADEDDLALADLEEQGFQASYSKLAASETKKADPASFAGPDVREYFSHQLAGLSAQAPGKIPQLWQAADSSLTSPFSEYMVQKGDKLV